MKYQLIVNFIEMKLYINSGLLALLLVMSGCKNAEQKHEKTTIPVRAVTVGSSTVKDRQQYVGTVEEGSSVLLSFASAGTVKTVSAKEGIAVQKGQLLATLDDRTAQSAYHAAKAALDRAVDGYRRAEQVYKKGSMPEVKWIEIQTQLEQAQSMADISQKNWEDCKLYAPQSGIIGDVTIHPGMNVLPYQPIMKVMNVAQLHVKVSIPENEITKIALGQKAKITVAALDNKEYEGIVDERSFTANTLSHSYPVRIRLLGETKGLLPGMVCKVVVSEDSKTVVKEIPNRAIQLDNDGRRFVWVAEHGVAVRKYVTIGDLTRTGVMISSGLEEGEKVITDGIQKISEGTQISVESK